MAKWIKGWLIIFKAVASLLPKPYVEDTLSKTSTDKTHWSSWPEDFEDKYDEDWENEDEDWENEDDDWWNHYDDDVDWDEDWDEDEDELWRLAYAEDWDEDWDEDEEDW